MQKTTANSDRPMTHDAWFRKNNASEGETNDSKHGINHPSRPDRRHQGGSGDLLRQSDLFDSIMMSDAPPHLPDDHEVNEDNMSLVYSLSGAKGRDMFILSQNRMMHDAGEHTAQQYYEKDVFRLTDTKNYQTYGDHTFSSPGRYNRPGESTLYNSESFHGVKVEADNYAGINGKTVVRSDFCGFIVDATSLEGITPNALTEPYGSDGATKTFLSKITGEDPYLHNRAFSDGARRQGAEAIRVPAHGDVTHINIFPENAADLSASYRYVDHRHADEHGRVGPQLYDPGVQLPPDGSAPNRNLGNKEVDAWDLNRHTRKGSTRYGAAGAATSATISSLQDGSISRDEAVGIGKSAVEGALISRVDDGLTQRFGGGPAGSVRSGMLLDGVVSAGTSLWQNADRFEAGNISAGDATADVIVDTGVGVSSGLAGMAAGAAVGSVVPVIGTAAGAVVGFATGMAASWLASTAMEGSGLADWAREGLGDVMDENFKQPLENAWETISDAQDVIQEGFQAAGSAFSDARASLKSFFGG